MSKLIKQGHEARLKIKAGIDKGADAVKPTLGAIGMSAIIEYPGLDPIECDDGVTILKNLEFKDKYENIGIQKLRKAGIRTSIEGGDGTATTTVLTQALVNEAFKEIKDSSKIREVRERLQNGLKEVLGELSKIKREVKEEEIEKIAKISSLDDEISKIIAEMIKEVGVDGVITVEKGAKLGYQKEIVKGIRFDKGFISPYFINDDKTNSVVLEDAYVVLVDRVISTNEQILPLLNSIGTGKDILIIADNVQSVALGTLALSAQNKVANIACVQNPYTGSKARDFLFDLASLTGGTVISEEKGTKLENCDVSYCGRIEKAVITENKTTIISNNTSSDVLEARIESLKQKIDESTSEYEKGALKDRLASLTGGIGVIRVGTYTDTEFNAKKYKFDNAINSTQSALQEGILPGGGSALMQIEIKEKMFKNILSIPFNQMKKNAGVFRHRTLNKGEGINFKTKEIVDMFEAGIIDPYKVIRLALESATAIAMDLVNIETVIVEE